MTFSSLKMTSSHGAWQKHSLSHLLQETDTFVTCVELVTSRGVITETNGRRVME